MSGIGWQVGAEAERRYAQGGYTTGTSGDSIPALIEAGDAIPHIDLDIYRLNVQMVRNLTDTHDWIPTSTEEAVAFDEWLERYNAAKAVYDGLLEEGHDKGWWTEKGPRLLDGRWVRKVSE